MIPCPGCSRFVRTDSRHCPFCDAVVSQDSSAAGTAVVGTFLALAVSACVETVAVYGAPSPGSTSIGSDSTATDSGSETGSDSVADSGSSTGSSSGTGSTGEDSTSTGTDTAAETTQGTDSGSGTTTG